MLLVAAYFVLLMISNSLYLSLPGALTASLLNLILPAVFLQLLLQFNNLTARFVQSYQALIGAWIIIEVMAFPFMMVFADALHQEASPGIAVIALLGFLVWNLLVLGHVIRHAIGIHLSLAMVLSVLFFLLSRVIGEFLVPLPVATG